MTIYAPFMGLPEADVISWRGITVTKSFYQYLDTVEAQCADAILANVRAGRSKEAEILSGKLEAIQELKSAITTAGNSAAVEAEEEFHDPAELVTK